MVLPGVCMCAPFEEGSLHLWVGGLVAHLLREVGSQMSYLTAGGGGVYCVRGDGCPNPHKGWSPTHAGAGMLHTKSFPNTADLGGCSPPLMWGMYHRARGFWITKCYPSAVAQHVQAFCRLFQGFTARAAPTKALVWGLSSGLHWARYPTRPCSAFCNGCLSYHSNCRILPLRRQLPRGRRQRL